MWPLVTGTLAWLPACKLLAHKNSCRCMQKSNFAYFCEEHQKIHVWWRPPPTMCLLYTKLDIEAFCRSWEFVFKKLFFFFVKIPEIKRKKLDGHRPAPTCYLCAKLELMFSVDPEKRHWQSHLTKPTQFDILQLQQQMLKTFTHNHPMKATRHIHTLR